MSMHQPISLLGFHSESQSLRGWTFQPTRTEFLDPYVSVQLQNDLCYKMSNQGGYRNKMLSHVSSMHQPISLLELHSEYSTERLGIPTHKDQVQVLDPYLYICRMTFRLCHKMSNQLNQGGQGNKMPLHVSSFYIPLQGWRTSFRVPVTERLSISTHKNQVHWS